MTAEDRAKDTRPDGSTTDGPWALRCPVPRGKVESGRLSVDHDTVDWVWVVEGSRPLDLNGPRPILRFESQEAAQKYNERVWSGACRVEPVPPAAPAMVARSTKDAMRERGWRFAGDPEPETGDKR